MRFTSSIDNVTAKRWQLSIQQAYLFEWIYSLPSWAEKVIINNETFFFASRNKAIEELPLLTDKIDTMYRYYKQLEQAGLIVLMKVGKKDFIQLTDKAKEWGKLGKKSDNVEKNPSQVGEISEFGSEKNPTNNTTTIPDKDTTNNTTVISKEMTKDKTEFVLGIIKGIREKYLNQKLREYKITEDRKKAVARCLKKFNSHWPGRDFLAACSFAFEYKAKEWFGTSTFEYFDPETLLSGKFIGYLEKAEMNKGKPYRPPKNGVQGVVAPPSVFKNMERFEREPEK